MAAGELRIGETLLLADDSIRRIESLTRREIRETVYNIEVDGEHVFFVGEDGVLVHNSCDRHHTIPREIRKSRRTGKSHLPNHLVDHPDIKGRVGNPNRWAVPRDVHRDIHRKGRAGGDFNSRWKEKLKELERRKPNRDDWTVQDILEIRDDLAEEFGIDVYKPD